MHASNAGGTPHPEPFPPVTPDPKPGSPGPDAPVIDPEKGVIPPVKLPGDPDQPDQKRV
ncbi:MAG: hypothetical protein J0H69_18200 [Burkholderiales bacterium]|nr:hypothetical protein [Burkholderiales bacterium]